MADFLTDEQHASKEAAEATNQDTPMFNASFNDDEDDYNPEEWVTETFLTPEEAVVAEEEKNKIPGEQPPAKEENKEKSLFDDEEEEEEEENEDIDVEAFNKKMGTNFENVEEIRNFFKKDETQDQEETERSTFTRNQNAIKNFEHYLENKDRDLVKIDLIAQYTKDKKDPNSPEIQQEIEDKLDGLEDLGQLTSTASLLRTQLKNAIDKFSNANNVIQAGWDKKKADEATNNRKQLQTVFEKVSAEGNFFGVTVDNDTIKKVYKQVTSGEFAEKANKDQGLIAKLALFAELSDIIEKKATQPTHSDGVKTIFDNIHNGKSRNLSQARGGTGNADIDNLVNAFIQ